MKFALKAVFSVAILLSFSACFWAGKWEDDSKNWKRAFGATIPEGVSVVHSVYWRTPHFTHEDGWTFQLSVSPDYRKKLFEHYKLRVAKPDENSRIEDMKREKPGWFMPKPNSAYECWFLADDPRATFGLFVDKESGNIFITDSG